MSSRVVTTKVEAAWRAVAAEFLEPDIQQIHSTDLVFSLQN